MLKIVQNYFDERGFLPKETSILLACSGGVDSMVLLFLLQQLDYSFAVAHANFQLRGSESNADEEYVRSCCEKNEISCFTKRFNTLAQKNETKDSIQMVARDLRYQWFKTLQKEEGFTHIMTAHHLDDQLETFLINTFRSSGLRGLCGIPDHTVLRPLQTISKEELLAFAKTHSLSWREDASNKKDDYVRNALRHHVIPQIKSIFPGGLSQFQSTLHHLQDAQKVLDNQMALFRKQFFINTETHIAIPLKAFENLPDLDFYLHALFAPYGLQHTVDIKALLAAESGKQLFSKTHRLIKNRTELLLTPQLDRASEEAVLWTPHQDLLFPLHLKVGGENTPTAENAILDADRLKYPLSLRKYQEGDYFYPHGMQGKKKLSKFFKDEKYSMLEKENQWLLCSENQIVWVIGKRIDARFAAQENTSNTLILQCQ